MARAVGAAGSGLAGQASRVIAVSRPACVRAVVFDMDGTLTEQGALDFALIRSRIGCPEGTGEQTVRGTCLRERSSADMLPQQVVILRARWSAGILEFIASHDDEFVRARLMAAVEEEERQALAKVEIRSGAVEMLKALRAQGERPRCP